jgi:hypothetical protein
MSFFTHLYNLRLGVGRRLLGEGKLTANEMYARVKNGAVPTEERITTARELLTRIENYWCPRCKDWRKMAACSACGSETLPGMSMYAQLDTINELRGMLSIPPLEGFKMPKGKRGPNWIEIMPATWVNLRRIGNIAFKGGGAVELDGSVYSPKESVIEAIGRWLGQREIKPS